MLSSFILHLSSLASAQEPFDLWAPVHLDEPIEVVVGAPGSPLLDPAIYERLVELGDGDPVLGYRRASLSVGVSADVDGTFAYDTQLVVSGVVEHDFPPPPETDPDAPPWLGPGIEDLIAEPPDEHVEVRLRARRSLLVPMLHRYQAVDEAILRGEDPQAAAWAWYELRQTRGAQAVDELGALVEGLGGEVLEIDTRVGEILASVPAVRIAELAVDRLLAALEREDRLIAEDANPAGYWLNVYGPDVDGVEIESLIQSTQFYAAGIHGQGENIGLLESEGDQVRRNHPGFADVAGNERHTNRHWNIAWWTNPDPDPGPRHPTATASLLIGDLTRGQDPSITNAWERRRRSGVARRATSLGMSLESNSRIVNQMTKPSKDIHVVNMSSGSTSSDPLCAGRDSRSRMSNELFESGVTLFASAGNEGQGPSWDCRVRSPGTAIGSITIAAYRPTDDGNGTVLSGGSSRGGTSTEGRGRTIIDVAAPRGAVFPFSSRSACFNYGAIDDDVVGCPATGNPYGGTSSSAALATGAFSLMHSWYRGVFGEPSPGATHALMLLMGDRRSRAGFLTTGHDPLWGAGRLRLRRYSVEGMEAPLRWTAKSRCVEHGKSRIEPVTTSPVTSGVDVMKVTAYLYDSRHDDAGSPNNDQVSLSLLRQLTPSSWEVVAVDSSTDNKMRLFLTDPTPGHYAVRLTGTSVGSDDEGCGTNATRVWFTYMHEGSDRPSGIGLDTVRPEDEDVE